MNCVNQLKKTSQILNSKTVDIYAMSVHAYAIYSIKVYMVSISFCMIVYLCHCLSRLVFN